MKSKWYELKDEALKLRKKGYSIRHVERKLSIPRSTLSGWFRSVVLSKRQKDRLLINWHNALRKARKRAVLWHNSEKTKRLNQAQSEAEGALKKINIFDSDILDLALAMLYLGEGFKKNNETAIGNSDPMILKFFIAVLRHNYKFDLDKIKCELHLRADQNPDKIKRYWARELGISLKNFTSISIDYRTKGSKTYSSYKGVCVLRCGTVSIQRKILNLSRLFCEQVINARG